MAEPRNQSEEPLPGSVSNQNAEEAEPGHTEQEEARRPPQRDEPDDESGGESSEGSQSTGSPHSAG